MDRCTCGPGGRPPDPHPDLNVCRHLGCDPECPTCPGDEPTMTQPTIDDQSTNPSGRPRFVEVVCRAEATIEETWSFEITDEGWRAITAARDAGELEDLHDLGHLIGPDLPGVELLKVDDEVIGNESNREHRYSEEAGGEQFELAEVLDR